MKWKLCKNVERFFSLLTLTFLFDRSGLEIQYSATVLRLRCAELLSYLLGIVGMNLRVQTGAEPIALGVVQHWRDRVGHVDDPARVAAHNEQEPIRRFEDQVLQLLIREKGRLVGIVRGSISGACDKFHFQHSDNTRRKQNNEIYRE